MGQFLSPSINNTISFKYDNILIVKGFGLEVLLDKIK